jgi:superoxide dismutase, Cu-Zn family
MPRLSTAVLALTALAACTKNRPEAASLPFQPVVVADLANADGEPMGHVAFSRADLRGEGTYVAATIHDLEPWSVHAIHVHNGTTCEPPDFESAGGHFAPDNDPHGPITVPEHSHAGDLGNVVANGQGLAVDLRYAADLRVGEGENALLGKAVILHEHRDDLQTQPAGNAGPRLACGVARVDPTAQPEDLAAARLAPR